MPDQPTHDCWRDQEGGIAEADDDRETASAGRMPGHRVDLGSDHADTQTHQCPAGEHQRQIGQRGNHQVTGGCAHATTAGHPASTEATHELIAEQSNDDHAGSHHGDTQSGDFRRNPGHCRDVQARPVGGDSLAEAESHRH